MARKLVVEIVGDSRSLERSFARSTRSAKSFGRDMERFGRGSIVATGALGGLTRAATFASTSFLGGAGFVYAAKSAVSAASDLNEEINKSAVVFGRNSGQVLSWSRQSARAFGLSRQAALAAAGGFGAMLETSGVAERQAATMSETLVKLAADMASFNNEDPTEMLDKLRSGLAGEAEPLRRFGVLLSEGRVKTEAYRLGIAKAGAQLTEQQKVQARYSLILRDTTRQQGDFARTSGGMANQMRILKAQLTDTGAAIGTAFLPLVKEATSALNEWLAKPENQREIRDTAHDLANNAGTFASYLGDARDTVAAIVNMDGPPPWWENWANDMQRRFDGWRSQLNLLPGVPLFRPGAGTLDRPGGGTFTPAPRPDNRAGPFGPGPSRPAPSSIPGSVSGTVPRQGPPTALTPFLSYLLSLAEATPSRKDDERILGRIISVLRDRLAGTKNLGARTELQQAINQVADQLAGLREQDAQVIKDAADRARERRTSAREKARTALQKLSDLLQAEQDARESFLVPLRFQIAVAKAGTTKTLSDDKRAARAIKSFAEAAIASGRLRGQGIIDAYNTIREQNSILDRKVESAAARLFPRKANPSTLLGGLHLTPAQKRELEGRLSTISAGGLVHQRGMGAFGYPLEATIVIDGRKTAQVVTSAQQKRARRNPPQKRGVLPRGI